MKTRCALAEVAKTARSQGCFGLKCALPQASKRRSAGFQSNDLVRFHSLFYRLGSRCGDTWSQIVAIVAHALKSGYRRAAWAAAGMVLGDVLYLATVLAGLAYIAETFSLLLIAIKWAGVAYLCWLAYRFWTSREGLNIDEGEDTGRGTNAFISGVLVTIGNPKSILFYVSIVPTVLDLHEVTLLDGAMLVLLTALILSAAQFQFPFAIAGARARLSFQSPRMMRLFNRGAAIGLGGAAVSIASRN
ncbi:LysE family translocator [Rhizobium laguerreae]|uniref:LysE family translocator n=1 Tax=Rhizobium laguerreae TaxID=1076926 RepID=UPI0028C3EBA5|nr:LysE family translocator [Rhizobium laguerreae]